MTCFVGLLSFSTISLVLPVSCGFRTSGWKGWALVTSALPVFCSILLVTMPESKAQMWEKERKYGGLTPSSWGHSHRSNSKLLFPQSFRCLGPSAWLPALLWDCPGVGMLEWQKGRKKTGKHGGFSPLSLSIRRPLPCWSLNEKGFS